jgi:hypothetical protein
MPITRRALLAGTVGLGVGVGAAACRPRRSQANGVRDPDTAALAAAVRAERGLLNAHDAVIARETGPGLVDLMQARARHAEHLAALAGRIPPTTQVTSTAPPSTRAELTALEQATVPALQAAAVAARDGRHAAVFASIAAAHGVPGARPALGSVR